MAQGKASELNRKLERLVEQEKQTRSDLDDTKSALEETQADLKLSRERYADVLNYSQGVRSNNEVFRSR